MLYCHLSGLNNSWDFSDSYWWCLTLLLLQNSFSLSEMPYSDIGITRYLVNSTEFTVPQEPLLHHFDIFYCHCSLHNLIPCFILEFFCSQLRLFFELVIVSLSLVRKAVFFWSCHLRIIENSCLNAPPLRWNTPKLCLCISKTGFLSFSDTNIALLCAEISCFWA